MLPIRLLAVLAAAAATALAAPQHAAAASVEVVPEAFSPRSGAVTVDARLARPQRVAVVLAHPGGKRLGWLSPPSRRRQVRLRWFGSLHGEQVADGRYLVQIVRGRTVLAEAPVLVDATAPVLAKLRVANGGRPFAGDGRLLTTVSPDGDGFRDSVAVLFDLSERATVHVQAFRTRKTLEEAVWGTTMEAGPGPASVTWVPAEGMPARTYLLRIAVTDRLGNRRVYGGDRRHFPYILPAPAVRVLGVEAAFEARSYAPGQHAMLGVETDARSLVVQLFRAGPEWTATLRRDELNGIEVTEPVTIDWSRHRSARSGIRVRVGDWPTGLYYARLQADDGRVGFAPFVVRPGIPGRVRVAVVLPTNTWAAYNFRDADGDGWGDTWYAGGDPPVRLDRAFLDRGVPPKFRRYDLGFLHWLYHGGRDAEFLSEEDLERFGTGDRLAATYDLVIVAGHTEYVTEREYDVVERYRDLGGNLWFLSANNFFWRVERRGDELRRVGLWRDLGRPEAALVGVQYLANDDGSRQAPFVVAADAPPWVWDGTSIGPGERVGSYGIEIDARTPDSPPGTVVLATVPDLLGPGRTAEMTYYETAAGAKVFAAGVLNFGGSAERWAVRRLLDNLWARTSVP